MYNQAILVTCVIIVGLLILVLIAQVIHAVRIEKTERVLLTNQMKILSVVDEINRKTPEPVEHWVDHPPLTDEDVLRYIRESGEMEEPLPLDPNWRVDHDKS